GRRFSACLVCVQPFLDVSTLEIHLEAPYRQSAPSHHPAHRRRADHRERGKHRTSHKHRASRRDATSVELCRGYEPSSLPIGWLPSVCLLFRLTRRGRLARTWAAALVHVGAFWVRLPGAPHWPDAALQVAGVLG